MEARNLISAQSMALDHDWLIPHLFTEIRLNKPPLPVWLTAPVFLLNPEPSMFALHLPVILITGLLGVFCYDLYKALFDDEKTALYAGLVASSMLLTLKLGTTNSWDIYSVVFMSGALVGLVKQGRAWLAAGTLLMAASVLSKGPVQLLHHAAALSCVPSHLPPWRFVEAPCRHSLRRLSHSVRSGIFTCTLPCLMWPQTWLRAK